MLDRHDRARETDTHGIARSIERREADPVEQDLGQPLPLECSRHHLLHQASRDARVPAGQRHQVDLVRRVGIPFCQVTALGDRAGRHEVEGRICRYHIGSQPTAHGRTDRADVLLERGAVDAELVSQVLRIRHRIEPPLPVGAAIGRAKQLRRHEVDPFLLAERGVAQAVPPHVPDEALRLEEVADVGRLPLDVHRPPDVAGDQQVLRRQAARLLELELLREIELVVEVRIEVVFLRPLQREHHPRRSLGCPQVDPVHLEFVLLGLAAEHGVLVEKQNRAVGPVLVIRVGG